MFLSVLDFLKNNINHIIDFSIGLSVGLIVLFVQRLLDKKAKQKIMNKKHTGPSEEVVNRVIDEVLQEVNYSLRDFCRVAITENIEDEWYNKQNCLSKMKVSIANVFIKTGGNIAFSKGVADRMVNNIVANLRNLYFIE